MIELIETLEAIKKHKTMGKAATSLRLTQSSVSKRIQTLEYECGKRLVVKNGRYIELTKEAHLLLEKSLPLVYELKDILYKDADPIIQNINIGFSESIISTWGARALAKYSKKNPQINITPHAHRSPVIVDQVTSSDIQLAIVAGKVDIRPGIHVELIGDEKMVIVGNKKLPLYCGESSSGTWRAIEREIILKGLVIDQRSEFFSPLAQLAKEGFCQSLVPEGVALKSGIKKKDIKYIGITRPIYALARKRFFLRQSNLDLMETLKKELNNL